MMSDTESQNRDESMWRMERAMIHGNARTKRKEWCECCGRAVPSHDFSAKFAQAGGVLAGPFCSEECYWRFIRDHWNETTKRERRHFYLYSDSDDEEQPTECVECGKDLTDPKNAGDPDEKGEWVCLSPTCRSLHDTQMSCTRYIESNSGDSNE